MRHVQRFKCLIDPVNGKPWVHVLESSKESVHLSSTMEPFSSSSLRRDVLLSMASKLQQHQEEMAQLECKNTGKPIRQARGDVTASIECLKYFSGMAQKVNGRQVYHDSKFTTFTIKEPLGRIGVIVSFNYPLLLAIWKIAPAIAAGNSVILKPAPQTPLTSLFFADLMKDILPKGLLQVIVGGTDLGQELIHHPSVAKVSFTGSTFGGQNVMEACSKHPKPVTLELGGKNPLIVFNDADLDLAVEGVIDAAFANAGQNCCQGSKLYLDSGIHSTFLQKLVSRLQKYKVGDPSLEETDMGPLIDQNQFEKVNGFIDRCQEKLLFRSEIDSSLKDGFFVPITVYHDVDEDAEIANTEIFGPVLAIMKPFSSVDEVIARANRTPYGLGAGVWTNDARIQTKVCHRLQAGMVWVNCYNDNPAYLPFGGRKKSGFGKDLGEECMEEFLFTKSVQIYNH